MPLSTSAAPISTKSVSLLITFMGNQAGKDEAGLLTKLNAAEAKLLQGKFDDAVAKLIDFKDAVMALRDAAKPKIRA